MSNDEGRPGQPSRPTLVAITGGSASGKSTLARRLTERLAHLRPTVVRQDQYFRAWGPDEQDQRTSNSPPAVHWDDLRADLAAWLAGRPAGPAPRLRGREGPRAPGDLLLLDGHLVLWDEEIRAMCDLKLYLDVPDEERVVRRLLRDVTTREMGLDPAAAWYRRDVLPNFPRYTAPARWWADLVVPANPVSESGFEAVVAAIEAQRARLRNGI